AREPARAPQGLPLMSLDAIRRWAHSHRRLAVGCVMGLAFLGILLRRLAGGAPSDTPPPVRPVPVAVEPARTGDIAMHLDGIGTVTPRATVTIRSRVDGELVAVHFVEGQHVVRGELLAEI